MRKQGFARATLASEGAAQPGLKALALRAPTDRVRKERADARRAGKQRKRVSTRPGAVARDLPHSIVWELPGVVFRPASKVGRLLATSQWRSHSGSAFGQPVPVTARCAPHDDGHRLVLLTRPSRAGHARVLAR